MDKHRKYLDLTCNACGENYKQQERVYKISKWPDRCRKCRKDLDKPKVEPKSAKVLNCLDCGTLIYRGGVRCKVCSNKSRAKNKVNNCIDCGCTIHRQATRCKCCNDKKQTTGGDPRVRFQNSKAWNELRTFVFERDDYTCLKCGVKGGVKLNAHHIKSYKDHPDLRLEKDNLITVCEPCHNKIHGSGTRQGIGVTKLKREDIPEIRRMLSNGEKQRVIGEKFGVSQSAINAIKQGRTWAI